MQIIVGTEPVEIPGSGRGRPIIQNLGPGTIYFDSETSVSADSGLQLAPGVAFEFATPSSAETGMWVVSDAADTDVRVIVMGA